MALAVLQTPDELFLDYELVAATDFPWYSPVDPTARDRLMRMQRPAFWIEASVTVRSGTTDDNESDGLEKRFLFK